MLVAQGLAGGIGAGRALDHQLPVVVGPALEELGATGDVGDRGLDVGASNLLLPDLGREVGSGTGSAGHEVIFAVEVEVRRGEQLLGLGRVLNVVRFDVIPVELISLKAGRQDAAR